MTMRQPETSSLSEKRRVERNAVGNPHALDFILFDLLTRFPSVAPELQDKVRRDATELSERGDLLLTRAALRLQQHARLELIANLEAQLEQLTERREAIKYHLGNTTTLLDQEKRAALGKLITQERELTLALHATRLAELGKNPVRISEEVVKALHAIFATQFIPDAVNPNQRPLDILNQKTEFFIREHSAANLIPAKLEQGDRPRTNLQGRQYLPIFFVAIDNPRIKFELHTVNAEKIFMAPTSILPLVLTGRALSVIKNGLGEDISCSFGTLSPRMTRVFSHYFEYPEAVLTHIQDSQIATRVTPTMRSAPSIFRLHPEIFTQMLQPWTESITEKLATFAPESDTEVSEQEQTKLVQQIAKELKAIWRSSQLLGVYMRIQSPTSVARLTLKENTSKKRKVELKEKNQERFERIGELLQSASTSPEKVVLSRVFVLELLQAVSEIQKSAGLALDPSQLVGAQFETQLSFEHTPDQELLSLHFRDPNIRNV